MDATAALIAQHEHALLEAIRQQDVAALDELLHPDLLFTLPTGQVITKAQDLATYQAGHGRVQSVYARNQQLRVFGSVAVVTVAIELRGFYQDFPLDGLYRYLRVWQHQQDGRWQVIAGSSLPLTA